MKKSIEIVCEGAAEQIFMLIVLIWLIAAAGCAPHVGLPTPQEPTTTSTPSDTVQEQKPDADTFADVLVHTEGVECKNLPGDCHLVYDSFVRARTLYATVNQKAICLQMKSFFFYRPENVIFVAGAAPRIDFAGTPVQGWFEPSFAPPMIVYAHERAVFCEALHGLAWSLGDLNWRVVGHNTPEDPLHFDCSVLIEKEYLDSQ